MHMIRKAEANDYDRLVPLFKQVHDLHVQARPDIYKPNVTPVSRELFKEQLENPDYFIFVAEQQNKLTGIAVLNKEEITGNPFLNPRTVLVLQSLCVAAEHRGQKIGSRLVLHAIDLAKAMKVNSLELGVSESNGQAVRFYERLGLKTKSRRMEYILTD